ncbi:MAG: hypothetical protein ACE5E5_09040 [Phycisphaerae bacterium]
MVLDNFARCGRVGRFFPAAVCYLILLGLGASFLCAGCDRPGHVPDAKTPAAIGEAPAHFDGESPMALVRRAHKLRRADRLDALEAVIDPKQARHVVALLSSLDRLEQADRTLGRAVKKAFGSAVAREFDHRALVNAAGVFSRDVALIGQHIDGNHATVTYQVAGRLPLDEMALVRSGGSWRIQTDDPIPEVVREIERLAEALTAVARLVGSRKMTVAQLRTELHVHEAPIGRRLADLTRKDP